MKKFIIIVFPIIIIIHVLLFALLSLVGYIYGLEVVNPIPVLGITGD